MGTHVRRLKQTAFSDAILFFQNELLSLTEAPAVEEVVSSHGQLLLDRIMRVSVAPGLEVIKRIMHTSTDQEINLAYKC